ncbi:MAG: ACP S-malonyltransferase, partial [Candidatus Gastranaerophilales bacterium]|nr:ACP S-malonyltransferase [Candidatus Gastranaerophilales bacterium]
VKEITDSVKSDAYVDVANYNTPEQIVITGTQEGIDKAAASLSEAGAKRVIPLAVSGAFHSEMMKDAGLAFAEFVSELTINDAKTPVVTNVDAKETTSASDFKAKMPEQIYSSVYWTQTVQYLESQGVDTIFEIGPGKVLAGLIKKIAPSIKVTNITDLKSIDAFVESLQEA